MSQWPNVFTKAGARAMSLESPAQLQTEVPHCGCQLPLWHPHPETPTHSCVYGEVLVE